MKRTKKRFISLMAFASLLWVEAAIATNAIASSPIQAPTLLAQGANQRIAVLQCGAYTITIRFDGSIGSDRFSYQTRGLFLRGGQMEGNDYVFQNQDYEYRVTVNFVNQYDTTGNGRLQVFHYGETILTRQCTWEN